MWAFTPERNRLPTTATMSDREAIAAALQQELDCFLRRLMLERLCSECHMRPQWV